MILQPADILLFRVGPKSTLLEKLIGWGQKVIHQAPTAAEYCHVALVGPTPDFLYEARWPRIHNIAWELPGLLARNPVEVYRVKNITPEQVKKVLLYAATRVGTRYDLLAILTLGVVQLGSTTVCSQYVWNSFAAGGVFLCQPEALESPDDIAGSDQLERVN